MKIAVLIGDGMGDYPLKELGGKTPLQAAVIPNIRAIAGAGTVRLVNTIPAGMSPGSDVANLSIMGFDPRKYYTGRAPIEAAGAGIAMGKRDVAFRCNLITVEADRIKDHSSGQITTAEARPIIAALNEHLGRPGLTFHVSAGYRHLLIWENGPGELVTIPPHDVLGQPAAQNLPAGARQDEVRRLMEASKPILAAHPVTAARRQAGKTAPTQIWLWGQGRQTTLPAYKGMFGLSGSVISAVDLVRGIGKLTGLNAVIVPGATGFLDTNYAGKVKAALNALDHDDFVFVHVEAPDECGHMGDLKLKLEAIEAFDREVVGPVWRGLEAMRRPYRLIIATDHRTPIAVRNHTAEPVPVAVLNGPAPNTGREAPFDEFVNGGQASSMAFEWLASQIGNRQS
ncbi:MAG: cofactor-independent phosphoglycerate mutase [Kiritimatiellota bacterium]|nr:cofactor-independent phosphoglycerate mutase [Kiritimatiellota bacterium]